MPNPYEEFLRGKIETGQPLTEREAKRWAELHPGLTPSSNGAQYDADLIPEVDDSYGVDELQPYIDRIDILDAYARWSGKNYTPRVGNKRESIMIRCPNPDHEDKNPSAWINLDKQVYACGTCGFDGGDKFHIAAWHFGYDVPHYQHDGSFPKLRADMVEDFFGHVVKQAPSGRQEVVETAPEPEPEPEPTRPTLAIIEPLPEQEEITRDEHELRIDWEPLVEPETFLSEWMTLAESTDIPHEYFFAEGLQAIAAAIGQDVYLNDDPPIYGQLFVLNFGGTSTGKTRASYYLRKIITDALPWTGDDYTESKGVKVLPSPGSAEIIVDHFSQPLLDPSDNKVIGLGKVRGILFIEELASFIARSTRSGNPMREILIQLFDSSELTHATRGRGTVKANAYALIHTTTQPQAIHSFLKRSDAASGFLNRWFIATGRRRRDRIAYKPVSFDLSDATNHLKSIHAWAATGHVMELAGDALKEWENFYQEKVSPMFDKTDDAMIGRVDLMIKKVMVLLCANEKLDHPTVEIVKKATSLFQYLVDVGSLVGQHLVYDEVSECRDVILDRIENVVKKTGKGPTRRELIDRFPPIKRFNSDVITKALAFLEQNDIVEIRLERGDRGPKTKRYYLP